MALIIRLSTIISGNATLNVCRNDLDRQIRILEWQPSGTLEYSNLHCVQNMDLVFLNKARAFIILAKQKKPDLVLTPEYSFPYEVLEEIINTKQKWPEEKQLWCLGCQGYNEIELENKLNEWGKRENIIVIKNEYTKHAEFVSPLFYLFRDSNGRLYILPQYKTGPMEHKSEQKHLSTGKRIYLFDLSNEKACTNYFISVICSDVLHNIQQPIINEDIKEDNLLVFHPQLNENPRQREFIEFRHDIFRNIKNARIITLNWAHDTKIVQNGVVIKSIKIPYSAFYIRTDLKETEPEHRHLRSINFKKGMYFSYDKTSKLKLGIWYSYRNECVKLFSTNNIAPVTEESFHFLDTTWEPEIRACNFSLENIIDDKGIAYNMPREICTDLTQCQNECIVEKCDYFFSLCFGMEAIGNFGSEAIEVYQLMARDEEHSRIVITPDIESDRKRDLKLRDEYYKLIDKLKNENNEIFSAFINNHKFDIDSDFPNQGNTDYNLVQLRCDGSQEIKSARVILKSDLLELSDAASLFTNLIERKELYRDNISKGSDYLIYIYYKPMDQDDYILFKEILNQPKISNGNIINKITNYKIG